MEEQIKKAWESAFKNIAESIDAVKTKKLKYFLEDYTLVETTEDWE